MLKLTAVLHPSALDARRGIVRLHPTVMSSLGLQVWDTVLLTGRRTTGALAAHAPPGAQPHALLCDDLVLGNLGVTDGAVVDVAAAAPTQAVSVVVAGDAHVVAAVDPAVLRTALLGKVLTPGDNVSLLPQDLAPLGAFDVISTRKNLATLLGPAWTSMLLTVVDVSPAGPALVTMATVVGWQGGTTTTGSATPMVVPTSTHAPTVADLPGLETQASALREWLDLGFHHQDLLARLGATPGMGVLVTGPAGSGKAALVESVTATVGARLLRAWAPSLAALEPTAAAQQVTALLGEAARTSPAVVLLEDVEALAPLGAFDVISTRKNLATLLGEASRTPPSVVLLEDVEALAPRDSASSLLPVFLTAVRDTIAAGQVGDGARRPGSRRRHDHRRRAAGRRGAALPADDGGHGDERGAGR